MDGAFSTFAVQTL